MPCMPVIDTVAPNSVAPSTSPYMSASITTLLQAVAPERRAHLERRLVTQFDLLRDRLFRLYGNTPGFDAWLEQLLSQTLHIATQRPTDLCQLDLTREAQPHWHQVAMLGYCAYADKFAGSLRGVAQRIPHLRELGVTYLHLLPFLKAGTPPNDGGFAVASYEDIEPSLGTLADLKDLTLQLRSADISLCSDFVLNHVSHEHAWAKKALAGDAHYQAYFHWAHSPEQVATWEQSLPQIFPQTAPGNFTYIPSQKAWAWTTFYPYQWDLNYANPAVFSEVIQALMKLANQGVEAFRLDSTAFLWKRAGTHCLNQPEVHWILQAIRSLMAIAAPGVLLKAEAIMPTRDLPPYFGLGETRGPECHLAYHASLMSASWVALAEQKVQIIQDVLANTPALPDGASWMSYVRCHDDIGWNVLRPELDLRGPDQRERLLKASQFFAGELSGSYARGASFQSSPLSVHGTNGMASALVGLASAHTPTQQTQAVDRLVLMYALAMFVGGLPLIYMGDELALGNVSPADMAERLGTDGRELHRPLFDESALALRHDLSTPQGQVFAALCAMTRARREHPDLCAPGALTVLTLGHAAVLGVRRGEGSLGLFNFSSEPVTLNLRTGLGASQTMTLTDLLHPEQSVADTLVLPPYAARWFATSTEG
jgi:amylosucrase